MVKLTMGLLDLNTDCLLNIFSYCSENDLKNLQHVHPALRNVIDKYIYRLRCLDLLLCGIRNYPSIMERTQPLTYDQRITISRNWQEGHYNEWHYFHRAKMCATKLHLEKDCLWRTYGPYLSRHERLSAEPLQRRYAQEIVTGNKGDISDFVLKNDTMFVGRVNGSCYIYEDNYATEQQLHRTKEYLRCVNFANDIYVTSTDKCAKLWRRSDELGLTNLELMRELSNSYKTIQFNKFGDRLTAGLYTSVDRCALREIDLESGKENILNSNTISIYDLKLKDENIIFTANFDTTFRIHDRRTNCDEAIWEDPFDSSFYCLEYDGLYGVLCGTKYHNRVNLYDIRKSKDYMQLYFPQTPETQGAFASRFGGSRVSWNGSKSSPVYSLACDSRYLFVATDRNVHVLDFKVSCGKRKDYRNIYKDANRLNVKWR